jgi:hypothetical protein
MAGQPELDLRAELARIDRDRAETQKLIAESLKFDKERWWFPWLQVTTVLVSNAAIAAAVGAIVARLMH